MSNTSVETRMPAVLLTLTAVTGIVDAVSFLSLRHVFTANMTGNIVFLGFAFAGAPGLSALHSAISLIAFVAGALIGGRMISRKDVDSLRWVTRAFLVEAFFLLAAAVVSIGLTLRYQGDGIQLEVVIALTAIAMGVRNAAVRKLGIPDLTTTVITLTITGLVADSALAGGSNPRWRRRRAVVLALLGGAIAGAFLLQQSVALPLAVCVAVTGGCALVTSRIESKNTGAVSGL